MSNTIETTTDRELLRSLIDGSVEELVDDTITNINRAGIFAGCTNLKKIFFPNVQSITSTYAFNNNNYNDCPYLSIIDLPNLTSSTQLTKFSRLTQVNFPKLTTFSGFSWCYTIEKIFLPKCTSGSFYCCGDVKYIILPNVVNFARARDCDKLIALDLGDTCTNINVGDDSVFYQTEGVNTEALILRSKTLLPLTRRLNANASVANDYGKYSCNKIYVPEALVEDYKVATNWSAYADIILSIEGSKYEHYWGDGTPIGLSNGTGLIAYYDVGNASDWDSETKTIASTVDNEFTTYGVQNGVFQHSIPTIYYNNYCSSNGWIDINLGSILSDISNSITVEWLEASSYTYLSPALAGYMNSNKQWSVGNVDTLGTNRIFHHFVLVLNNSNAELYCDGQLYKNPSITNALNINRLVVGSSGYNLYLGPVSVWNRALTQEEIAEHYQYYVDNFHVGETAFDSSGNFIAE